MFFLGPKPWLKSKSKLVVRVLAQKSDDTVSFHWIKFFKFRSHLDLDLDCKPW